MKTDLYRIPVRRIDGAESSLSEHAGKVLLVVNVASKCGLTPQYDALEAIYGRYREKGFAVLGFPANEFGEQEPGSNEEIHEFCRSNFGVKFPMHEKIVVKGPGQHPLYQFLTTVAPEARKKPGTDFESKLEKYGIKRERPHDILWNFEKFLINRKGEVVARFAPDVTPDDPMLAAAIEEELARG